MDKIIHLESVNSTNSWLKQHKDYYPTGTVVTALRQIAGKGRLGHEWLDCEGMLPMSVLLKNPSHPSEITLCAAVAVCRTLELIYGKDYSFGIKWPNDIILESKKICGILCESVCSHNNIEVICGIGINLSQTKDFFEKSDLPHGASLKMLTGFAPDREVILEKITENLLLLCENGIDECLEEYKNHCVTLGKQVKLVYSGNEKTAFAKDITADGYLLCEDENGTFEVNSGEVSVRGLYGYI